MASSRAVPSTSRAIHSCARSAAQPRFRPVINSSKSSEATSLAEGSAASAALGKAQANRLNLLPLTPNRIKGKQVGKALAYPDTFVKSLPLSRLPRGIQRDFALADDQPATVVRRVTSALVESLDGPAAAKARKIIVGRMGSGRTTTLLQTIAYCQASDWAVLYIPNAHSLVDGTYPYSPNQENPKVFDQAALAQIVLQDFLKSKPGFRKSSSAKEQIEQLERAAKDPSLAFAALEGLLTEPGSTRILLAIDGAEALDGKTAILDAQARPVNANKLQVARLFQDLVTGRSSLSNGAVVAATDKQRDPPKAWTSTVEQVEVGPLSLAEAASLYEHLNDLQLLHKGMSDADFLEAFVGSDGNVLEFSRGLSSLPGGTARGVVRKGRGRGVPQRADKVVTVTV